MKRLLILICIFPLHVVFGQHDDQFNDETYLKSSDVKYTIHARVNPDEGVVHASMELEFKNYSNDVWDTVWFGTLLNEYQPGSILDQRYDTVRYDTLFKTEESRGYCNIDSINYRGAPIDSGKIHFENGYLSVALPTSLQPGEKGFFLISFESKIPVNKDRKYYVRLFRDWIPRLMYYSTTWETGYNFGWAEYPTPYADYYVSITVPQDYALSYPGRLINDREIYPDLPKKGLSIGFDNSKAFSTSDQKGMTRYDITATSVRDFPFSLSKNYKRDRLVKDHLVIETVYDNNCKYEWKAKTIQLVDSLIASIEDVYGRCPYKYIQISAIDSTFLQFGSCPLIFIPRDVKKQNDMAAYLLVELTKLWESPVIERDQETPNIQQGLAYYLAATVAYDRYTDDGYGYLQRFEGRMKKKTKAYKLLDKDRKALNPFGYPVIITNKLFINDIDNIQSYFQSVFRDIPGWFRIIRFMVGDTALTELLKTYARRNQFKLSSENDLFEYFEDNLPELQFRNDELSNLYRDIDSIDFSISNESIELNDSSSHLTASITNRSAVKLPIEIAFINQFADTLYDTIAVSEFEQGVYHLDKVVAGRIDAIALDPNYYLPDVNRFDNYFFRMPVRFKVMDPKNLFIGYRKF